jgi:hypothetical protein
VIAFSPAKKVVTKVIIPFASIEKSAKLPAMIVQKNNAIRLREEISLSPLFVSTVLNRLSAYRYSGS